MFMNRRIAFICLAALSFACRRETTQSTTLPPRGVKTTTIVAPPTDLTRKKIKETIPIGPPLVDDKGIGSKPNPDGTVSGEQKGFRTTEPIYLTMKFHDSPHGLQSSIVVEGKNGRTEFRDQKAMNGGKVVTFTVPAKKLKPGHYRVDGYWGGNVAAEYEIDVK